MVSYQNKIFHDDISSDSDTGIDFLKGCDPELRKKLEQTPVNALQQEWRDPKYLPEPAEFGAW